ncbi:DUF2924 domain-containing protein [Bremerella sp. P1]|uniref:DUF2924 domain-containing protein n=1 Tax=Bremerella sp. P1 TaxID=3026424 RepID=UPI0023688BC9|nr:DUF2924 domain-containing protein [Bremerella sp. P1]WDI40535.1 DUF2924 domain-containing protein [Bremerella sp. P1]
MSLNIDKEVAAMERMTVNQLREKYDDVFGEPTNGRHKQWLIKRIAWRMQANAEGGLSERARRRAMELANDADLRVTMPRAKKPKPMSEVQTISSPTKTPLSTHLLPGMLLQRVYKGNTIRVAVLADGFEWEGERYKSLTAVAKAVTGKHWNGFHFFGLRKNRGGK